jgi:hypothetical protein
MSGLRFLQRNLILGLFLIVVALFSGCTPKQHIYKSSWQSTQVSIDCNINDWKLPLQFEDQTTKLNYSVSNDNNNLYICIQTDNDATVSGIIQRGLQLWLDTTGRKNHQVGIMCPIPQGKGYSSDNNGRHQRTRNSENGQQAPPDTVWQNQQYRLLMESIKQMHISGFKTVPDGLVNLHDTSGIQLCINLYNYKVFVYEAAIPLKAFLKYPLLLSDSSRVIGISFNFTSMPKGSSNRGGGGGFHPGFGIGMGMMGVMVGGGGMQEDGGPSEPETKTIWTPFHLATLPEGN